MFMFFYPAIHFPTTIPMNISHFSSSSFSVSAFKADSRQEKELMKKVRKRENLVKVAHKNLNMMKTCENGENYGANFILNSCVSLRAGWR